MSDPLLAESVDRLLQKVCSFDVVEQAERDGWCASVWDPLAEAGFTRIAIPEEFSGSGGSLADALAVLRAVGHHAAPVPVAETTVLGGWLLVEAGIALPDGPITVVPDADTLGVVDGRLTGRVEVPWGRHASTIVALARDGDGWLIAPVPRAQLEIEPGANLAGEPRDTVRFDHALDDLQLAPAPAGVDIHAFRLRGALTRVVLMAGATEALSRLTIDYAHERHQFGQAIARFQAVQHHLVNTAQCAAKLSMAADIATHAAQDSHAGFEIAAAKIIADDAVVEATRSAHQVHGAMGMTREYPLHQHSRRLWAWRHEYGSGREWRQRLGGQVAEAGADALFESIAR